MRFRHLLLRKTARRHDWTSLWLAAFCALLMVSPAGAAPLSLAQTRQVSAQYEAVLWWLEAQTAAPDSDQTRAAVLHVLCERAGLDEIGAAQFISQFENWAADSSQSHQNAPCGTLSPQYHPAQRNDASYRLRILARAPHESSRRAHLLICRFSE